MRTNRIITITFSVVLGLSACHKRVPAVALPPAPPPPSPAASALDEGDRAFTAGRYDDAARAYENYLRLSADTGRREQALFQLGLAYALRPAADWQRAASAFRQIVEGFPNSPLKAPASLILSLHTELDQLALNTQQRDLRIKQLTTELDRLKRIDADRRKRP